MFQNGTSFRDIVESFSELAVYSDRESNCDPTQSDQIQSLL